MAIHFHALLSQIRSSLFSGPYELLYKYFGMTRRVNGGPTPYDTPGTRYICTMHPKATTVSPNVSRSLLLVLAIARDPVFALRHKQAED